MKPPRKKAIVFAIIAGLCVASFYSCQSQKTGMAAPDGAAVVVTAYA